MTILLGAGASANLKVPMAVAMTKEMVTKAGLVDKGRYGFPAFWVLGLVVGGLQAAEWRRGIGKFDLGINVEDVFNAVELLSRRHTLEAAAFVTGWDPRVQEIDRLFLEPDDKDLYEQAVSAALDERSRNRQASDEAFASAVAIAMEGRGQAFRITLDWMVEQLQDMTYIQTTELLGAHRRFVHAAYERDATIATLNYDNAIERACLEENVPCSVGVDDWPSSGQLRFRSGALPLLKLHGSILWWEAKNLSKAAKTIAPQFSWGNLNPDLVKMASTHDYGPPVLLFGHRNKLTADGPFLDLLAEWKRRLWEDDELRVVGYGFGDDHLNQIIARWLETDKRRVLKIYNVLEAHDMRNLVPDRIKRQGDKMIHYQQWERSDGPDRVFEN